MRVFMGRWKDGTVSIVAAESPEAAFDLVDELGDPNGPVWIELKHGFHICMETFLIPETCFEDALYAAGTVEHVDERSGSTLNDLMNGRRINETKKAHKYFRLGMEDWYVGLGFDRTKV